MPFTHELVVAVGFCCLAVAACYAALNVLALLVWRLPRRTAACDALPPVTILKPLCGAEPGLYEDLRSFCAQDYPDYQIVFGVRDRADPAYEVAERIAAEFPRQPVEIVASPLLHGTNCKISNLINMLPHARHDYLVMADSDACVGKNYLRSVSAPLLDPRIGLVTCIYRGVPTPGIWSRLGAMYVNEWYMPSVLLAWLFGHQGYVSGQTVCMRRDTLAAIGGFGELADHLADDYRLGELVRNAGLRVFLSPFVVSGEHHESSFDSVSRHEMRWMSTIRVVRPRSFRGLFLTFSLPLAIFGILALGGGATVTPAAWTLLAIAIASRLVVHFAHRVGHPEWLLADLGLVPLRDLLTCWVWARCFFTSRVTWRGNHFDVDANGVMHKPT